MWVIWTMYSADKQRRSQQTNDTILPCSASLKMGNGLATERLLWSAENHFLSLDSKRQKIDKFADFYLVTFVFFGVKFWRKVCKGTTFFLFPYKKIPKINLMTLGTLTTWATKGTWQQNKKNPLFSHYFVKKLSGNSSI